MSKARGAGDLRERVAFDVRSEVNPDAPDDFGNTVDQWVEQFSVAAGFINLRGGESVMQSRLTGRRVIVAFVHASSQTRAIETDWRLRNARTGEAFNIREVTLTTDRKWVDILCESGVATG